MTCYHPATLLLYEDIRGNKKTRYFANRDNNLIPSFNHDDLKFDNSQGFFDTYKFVKEYSVPCGKCIGCQLDRARDWSQRLMAEYKSSVNAYFITLTYDDEHLPKSNQLQKKEAQFFVKSLKDYFRKHFNFYGIKYYLVGEYGSSSWRPHYHLIVYNLPLDLKDFELLGLKAPEKKFLFRLQEKEKCSSGLLYSSIFLNKMWNKGINRVGQVSAESCAYVARYCNKKISRDYDIKEALKEINFQPEFMLCSKNLGKKWYLDNANNLLDNHLKITFNGKIVGLPRYFKKYVVGEDDPRVKFETLKNEIHSSNTKWSQFGDKNEILKQCEDIKIQDSKKLKRKN